MRPLLALALAPIAAAIALSSEAESSKNSPIVERQAANSAAAEPAQPTFSFAQLWDLNKKFLDNFVYPADVIQAKAINSTILSEDVQGRIDITRTFNGRELNTEYLFGLFANLAEASEGAISLLGVPLSYEILHFAANQNIVTTLTRFQFNFTALNLVVPVEIDAWNTFNQLGQISQYDATFKHWQWTVDYLLQAAGKKFGTNTKQATVGVLQEAIAKSICQTSMTNCKGTSAQYQTNEACFAYLTKEVRFGEAYELGTFLTSSSYYLSVGNYDTNKMVSIGKNTLLCRMVHQNMVPFRPKVHCPHIGPTGGGYCNDDKDYEMTVMENYFTNSPYIPFGYKSPGPAPASS
ncbi:MAG: hypothetical protein Q9188_006919 [Gyalolechia gomerana]